MKELSLHILDLVENSIRASATEIKISIIEDIKKDTLSIIIEDNGRGMDEEFLKKASDPFATTRNTRNIGLGIPLMKAACERCDGSFNINSKVNKGTKVEGIFKHSHIDRAPLGNISETIVSLIHHSDNTRIIYTHNVENKEFVLDTREIKELLGDVEICSPEILLWIRDYVKENEKKLYL